jgi:O-antigen/teichoic acid export membrane protein
VLGTEGFGQVSYALAIISYAGLLVGLGLPGIGMREVAKSPERVQTFSGSILTLRSVASVVTLGLLLSITYSAISGAGMRSLLLWYGFSLIPLAFIVDWVFLGIQKAPYVGAADTLRSGIYLLLVILTVKGSADLVRVPQAYLVATVVMALFFGVSLWKVTGRPCFRVDVALWKSLFARGWPFAVSAVLAVANVNIGMVVLGATRGAHETGLYGASFRVVTLLMSFATFLLVPMFPIYVQNFEQKSRNLRALASRAMWFMAIVAVPLAVGGTLLSRQIVEALYGSEYAEAARAMAVLLWATGFFFLREVFGYGLTAWNLQFTYARILAISVCTNLLLNVLLTPHWGILAAAGAMLLSEVVNLVLMARAARSVVKVSPLLFLWKPALAAGAMGAVVGILRSHGLEIAIPAGAVCYLVALIAVRGIGAEDWQWLRTRIARRTERTGGIPCSGQASGIPGAPGASTDPDHSPGHS